MSRLSVRNHLQTTAPQVTQPPGRSSAVTQERPLPLSPLSTKRHRDSFDAAPCPTLKPVPRNHFLHARRKDTVKSWRGSSKQSDRRVKSRFFRTLDYSGPQILDSQRG